MKLRLEIEGGNDAMQDGNDMAWALNQVADRLRDGRTAGIIRDDNGNKTGQWEVTDD